MDGVDMLQDMLDRQAALQARLPRFADSVSQTQRLIDNAEMAACEAVEWKNGLPWKKHRQDYGRVLTSQELEHVLEEIVDVLHFVLNGFLVAGVTTSEEVYARFLTKHQVNHKRQNDGY